MGEDKPFKVTDRRGFTAEGAPKTPDPAAAETAVPPDPAPEAAEEIDFTTFLISLAANAMHHLGEGPEGPTGQPNLPLARQTIDIIALLQHKTRGNLSGEEERLLESILYDLRMRFVSATRK
jgi:hypothetical protein